MEAGKYWCDSSNGEKCQSVFLYQTVGLHRGCLPELSVHSVLPHKHF